ncbi:MAG: helix-turn-helix transcriptional regulator, partial [Verrucomicrobiales bacterium]
AFTILLKGGFTDQQFAQYVQIQDHPEMVMLNAPLMEEFCRQPRHITRHRGQLDPDNQFDQTEVHALWKNADIGPLILSMRPVGEAKNSAILLARRWHKPEFSDRENRIAHILLSEVPWLHQDSWPNHPTDQAANLSPRLNTITNLLLQGNSRKQMAAELDLSIHTVNEYVKHVYHLFGVHSQSALIHKFIKGDGGDLRTHP